ncbi:MAG: glycosyltransferase [bacterium]
MKISIITVCKNPEESIKRTVESVLSQTYQNIEYIIVDGASTDGTVQVINAACGFDAVTSDQLRVNGEDQLTANPPNPLSQGGEDLSATDSLRSVTDKTISLSLEDKKDRENSVFSVLTAKTKGVDQCSSVSEVCGKYGFVPPCERGTGGFFHFFTGHWLLVTATLVAFLDSFC